MLDDTPEFNHLDSRYFIAIAMDAIQISATIGTTHAPIATLKIEAIIQYVKRQKSIESSILYPCGAIGVR